MTNETFKFQNLEITSDLLVLHFDDEKTVIPMNEIKSYGLKWHLHDPIFGKKWWFLVLTLDLKNGEEESGPVATTKFKYIDTDRGVRQHIEDGIAVAISEALAKHREAAQEVARIGQGKTRDEATLAKN